MKTAVIAPLAILPLMAECQLIEDLGNAPESTFWPRTQIEVDGQSYTVVERPETSDTGAQGFFVVIDGKYFACGGAKSPADCRFEVATRLVGPRVRDGDRRP